MSLRLGQTGDEPEVQAGSQSGHRSGAVRVPDWAFHRGGPAGGGRGRPGGLGSADWGCGSSNQPQFGLKEQNPAAFRFKATIPYISIEMSQRRLGVPGGEGGG